MRSDQGGGKGGKSLVGRMYLVFMFIRVVLLDDKDQMDGFASAERLILDCRSIAWRLFLGE